MAHRSIRVCTMTDITHSYRIRAYPNGAQRRLLDRWFGGIRWLWNTTLEIRSAYSECGLTLTGNDLSRWLTQWKRTSGHEWLAEIPSTALTQSLRDQDGAMRNFFAQRARRLDGWDREFAEAGIGIAPIWNRRGFDSSAVKS